MKTHQNSFIPTTLIAAAAFALSSPLALSQGKVKFDATDDEKPVPVLRIQLVDAKGRALAKVRVTLKSHTTGKSTTATTNTKGYIQPYTAQKGTKVSIFPHDSRTGKLGKAAAVVVADRGKIVRLKKKPT